MHCRSGGNLTKDETEIQAPVALYSYQEVNVYFFCFSSLWLTNNFIIRRGVYILFLDKLSASML